MMYEYRQRATKDGSEAATGSIRDARVFACLPPAESKERRRRICSRHEYGCLLLAPLTWLMAGSVARPQLGDGRYV